MCRSQRGSACAEAHCCREPTRQKNCARGSGRTPLPGCHRGWTGMEFLKRILMEKKKLEFSASCHSHSHLPMGFLHRLNMQLDLQSLFGLLCTHLYSLAETPQLSPLPPAFGLIDKGRYWSAKIGNISL